VSDRGEILQLGGLRFKRTLPGPLEKVWQHLTDTRLMPAWFGEESRIEPCQGGRVSLMGGHIRGTVTQWQPPRKLVYTWNVFDPADPEDAISEYPESYPTFELSPAGDDVLLIFVHFPIPERFLPQTSMGWHTMLDILQASLRGESVTDRSAYAAKNAELYGVDLNNLET